MALIEFTFLNITGRVTLSRLATLIAIILTVYYPRRVVNKEAICLPDRAITPLNLAPLGAITPIGAAGGLANVHADERIALSVSAIPGQWVIVAIKAPVGIIKGQTII